MALITFKEQFDNTYEEIFQKMTVGLSIANTRFESDLKEGDQLRRVRYDISGVRVRQIQIGVDRIVDAITDSPELITINQNAGTTFAMSERELKQAGSLSPATVIGATVAKKTSIFVDASILFETTNAFSTFDTGSLTTLVPSGVPITLAAATVPQLASRAPAFLKRNNITGGNMVFVTDAVGASDVIQYLLGKQADFVSGIFRNGFMGPISTADLYESENLTGEADLTAAGANFAPGETVTINGVVFTFVAALTVPAVAGEVLVGVNTAASLTNLTAAINLGAGSGVTYTPVSAANQLILQDDLRLSAATTATVLTIQGIGSGRLTVADTAANAAWTRNFIHCYWGKKGAIDVVMQMKVDMDMRDEPKQRAKNIMSDYLFGIMTFFDGSQKFLDVLIAA